MAGKPPAAEIGHSYNSGLFGVSNYRSEHAILSSRKSVYLFAGPINGFLLNETRALLNSRKAPQNHM